MTPDEIKKHPTFSQLTDKQQTFVVTMLDTAGDKIKSAHAAWQCKSDDSARAMASKAAENPNVSFLLESYFGADPKKLQFTRETALQHAAQKARTAGDEKVALGYFNLIVDMEGWRTKPAENKAGDPPQDMNAIISI